MIICYKKNQNNNNCIWIIMQVCKCWKSVFFYFISFIQIFKKMQKLEISNDGIAETWEYDNQILSKITNTIYVFETNFCQFFVVFLPPAQKYWFLRDSKECHLALVNDLMILKVPTCATIQFIKIKSPWI